QHEAWLERIVEGSLSICDDPLHPFYILWRSRRRIGSPAKFKMPAQHRFGALAERDGSGWELLGGRKPVGRERPGHLACEVKRLDLLAGDLITTGGRISRFLDGRQRLTERPRQGAVILGAQAFPDPRIGKL